MEKMDARKRYTQMVLKQSFLKLLKEKPVNRITVKEVCALAQLNRATFYAHYSKVITCFCCKTDKSNIFTRYCIVICFFHHYTIVIDSKGTAIFKIKWNGECRLTCCCSKCKSIYNMFSFLNNI